MILAKFPTASETERIYICLTRTPRAAVEIARIARLSVRKTDSALQSLHFQRRAVLTCSGWIARRTMAFREGSE